MSDVPCSRRYVHRFNPDGSGCGGASLTPCRLCFSSFSQPPFSLFLLSAKRGSPGKAAVTAAVAVAITAPARTAPEARRTRAMGERTNTQRTTWEISLERSQRDLLSSGHQRSLSARFGCMTTRSKILLQRQALRPGGYSKFYESPSTGIQSIPLRSAPVRFRPTRCRPPPRHHRAPAEPPSRPPQLLHRREFSSP